MQIAAPEGFNFGKPNEWPIWFKRFQRYRIASGLSEKRENEQVNALVYIMGDKAEEILILFNLSEAQNNDYKLVVSKFQNYFIGKRNVIYERAKFNRRSQGDSEPVEEFITNLYVLAENCNYGILKEEMIRDRLVVGVKNFNLSEKLQLESELTLEKAIQIVRQSESVKNQQKEIRQNTENRNVDAIDKKGGRNGTFFQKNKNERHKNKRKCFRCGYYQGHSKEQCPAKDAICNKCRKKGHFAKVCHTKTIQEVSRSQNNAFIGIVGKQENAEDKWCEVIKVNDQPIKFKIDTEVEVSVMPEEIYLQHFGYLKTEKADKNLLTVSKNIEVNGMFQTFLEQKGRIAKASEILGLVRRINIVEDHAPTKLEPMLKFPKLLTGLGKIDIPYEIKEIHPIPVVEHTLVQLKGTKLFTKLDANSGFWQIPLSSESSALTTFITPFGRFRFKRLPFGNSSAPEIFQKRMGQILEGLEGTLCHMDDILVYGSCQEEHDKRLETVLAKLFKSGLTLNKDKCKFAVVQLLSFYVIKLILTGFKTLSETEKRYAQIEKEALAITWACEKFKQYIQGLVITLETDHKPLVPIFTSKNIDDLTPRIKRLRLRIMRYSYKIVHTPGKNLIVADALSRSPRIKVGTQELEEELCAYVQQVVSFVPISDVRVKEIKESQDKDQVIQNIIKYTQEGWPERTNVSMSLSQYWPAKDDFSIENGILLKGSRYDIPENIRKGLLQRIHEGHLGIVKCRERAKGSVWRPGSQAKLRRWSERVLCVLRKEQIDISLYYPQSFQVVLGRKFPEIARLVDMTSASVIVHCKSIFARHGIPLEVRSDNGPQFGSLFKEFAQDYGFTHVTSNPRYPQSNGFI
ncbi:K02A2.6-like [Cordylochernes scorpioides]|uniref:K02A2.6-like n=1 Tax=Cordylochernes scorpioides TaxID=51811 RepID=A0ABY6LIA3_9ARAC|nr:K02A2.6-like [Cordylochernes scorpioides]